MRVLHVACTPLAGSPIRIVSALRQHLAIDARLVVLAPNAYGRRTFAQDWVWDKDREAVIDFAHTADIIHFHHYFDFSHNPFGFDFCTVLRRAMPVRQFHSTPYFIAQGDPAKISEVVNSEAAQLVVCQYMERYFPRARLVPNIVPLTDPAYTAASKPPSPVRIVFSPSGNRTAWCAEDPYARWDTKATPETRRVIERAVARHRNVVADVIMDTPHADCLLRKRQAHIAIDDLSSGSFHLSSLESLAQGVPTLAFLDQRTQQVIQIVARTSDHPWINTTLDDAGAILDELIDSPELLQALGHTARQWMLDHWSDAVMVRHYGMAYDDLLNHPDRFRKLRFAPGDHAVAWNTRHADDIRWLSRRARHEKSQRNWLRRLLGQWAKTFHGRWPTP